MYCWVKSFVSKRFSNKILRILRIQIFYLPVYLTKLRVVLDLALSDANKGLIADQGPFLDLVDVPHKLLIELVPFLSQVEVVCNGVLGGLTMWLKCISDLSLRHLLWHISRRKPSSISTSIHRLPSNGFFFLFLLFILRGIDSFTFEFYFLYTNWRSFDWLFAHISFKLSKLQFRHLIVRYIENATDFRSPTTGRITLLFTSDLYVVTLWKSWHVQPKDVVLVRQSSIWCVREGCGLNQ